MPFYSRWSPRTVGLAAAVVTVAIWTLFIVIARASAQRQLAPLDIVYARLLGAGLLLLPLGWWLNRRQRAASQPTGWLGLSPLNADVTAQLGLWGGLAHSLFAYSGFFYAPATHASVLLPGSLPLWTTLLAIWVLHERVTAVRALCLALILLGDLLVGGASLMSALTGLGGDVWKGDLLFMAGAISWSYYSVLLRRHRVDAVAATVATTVFAFLVFVPIYTLAVLTGYAGTGIGPSSAGEVLFQAVFQGMVSLVVAGMTFTLMVRYFGPVRSTMITALVPGLSALGAVLFLSEPLHLNLLLGLMLVTLGIALSVRGVGAVASPSAAVTAADPPAPNPATPAPAAARNAP